MDLHTGGHMRYTRTEYEPVSLQGWVHVHPKHGIPYVYGTRGPNQYASDVPGMYLACTSSIHVYLGTPNFWVGTR